MASYGLERRLVARRRHHVAVEHLLRGGGGATSAGRRGRASGARRTRARPRARGGPGRPVSRRAIAGAGSGGHERRGSREALYAGVIGVRLVPEVKHRRRPWRPRHCCVATPICKYASSYRRPLSLARSFFRRVAHVHDGADGGGGGGTRRSRSLRLRRRRRSGLTSLWTKTSANEMCERPRNVQRHRRRLRRRRKRPPARSVVERLPAQQAPSRRGDPSRPIAGTRRSRGAGGRQLACERRRREASSRPIVGPSASPGRPARMTTRHPLVRRESRAEGIADPRDRAPPAFSVLRRSPRGASRSASPRPPRRARFSPAGTRAGTSGISILCAPPSLAGFPGTFVADEVPTLLWSNTTWSFLKWRSGGTARRASSAAARRRSRASRSSPAW